MSKQESIIRHRIIIQKLRTKPCTFQEISDKLEEESELHDQRFHISQRTFQRDLKEILTIYGTEIVYDRSLKAYKIINDEQDEYSERLFEAIDIYQVLNLNQSMADYIQFDTRKAMGSEHLSGLLYAIQNRYQVQFRYKKFTSEQAEVRIFEPYLLKEFRKRWYVFGYDIKRKEFRTFGLDRLYALNITQIKFQHPQDIDPITYFEDCFGIVGPSAGKAEKILLEFTEKQGNYIRTMPLHKSQEIIEETEEKMLVKLKLIPSYDFEMELLFYGDSVKVIEPKSLAEKLAERLKNAVQRYD